MSIDNKTLDELIIKWSKQLAGTSKIFNTYTDKVREWDQQLVVSGDEILRLNQDSIEAEALQSKIDQHLLFVESQQNELEKVLDNYEQQADILLNNIELNSSSNSITNHSADAGGSGSGADDGGSSAGNNGDSSTLSVTDKLREKAYHSAELLDERLDNLGDNLSTLISEINAVSEVFTKNSINEFALPAPANGSQNGSASESKSGNGDENPIEEIVKLLNLHLDNLKYIEDTEEKLKTKINKINNIKKTH